jgi:C-terminal processing protease CtpA/Prc
MADIRNGDYIVKIDTYDIKNLKVENIGAYVENRAKNGAILKITYSRNNEQQTVALQL